jgi:hypothetical protein
MPIPQLPGVGLNSLDDVVNYVIRLERELRFLMESGLDSSNAREFGGWIITPDKLASLDGMVGFSTTGATPTSIRIWAGSVDPTTGKFRVSNDGSWFSSNGTIEGGVIRTNPVGQARIEMSGGKFTGLNPSGQKTGMYFDINTVPGTGIADIKYYHNDSELLVLFDNISSYTIKPGSAAASMTLGDLAKTTYANGQFVFDTKINGSILNADHASNADYATSAGSATTVPSTGVTPGTYPKVVVAADGRVTQGQSLIASDIPSITLSKISDAGSAASKNTGVAAGNVPVLDAGAKLALSTIPDPGSSLASSGYQKLPSGLILQWGQTADVSVASGGSANQTFTFPIPFPTNCFQVVATLDATGASANGSYANENSKTLTNVGIVLSNTTASSQTYRARVWAVGN